MNDLPDQPEGDPLDDPLDTVSDRSAASDPLATPRTAPHQADPALSAAAQQRPFHTRPAPLLMGNRSNSPTERLIGALLGLCALVTVFTTVAIAGVLLYESLGFFSEVSPVRFLTDTQWTAQIDGEHYGIWPLLSGTMLITVIAAVVALPLGLAAAIYVSQYASERVRRYLKPGLELLAGVPTIVYGFFALTFVTPLLQGLIPGLQVYNALSAGIVVGIMIIPLVASLSEDALRSVPRSLAEGAYALGATKVEVVTRVLVPGALSGIVASFILAISRAIGETMIVMIAAGAQPRLTFNPLASVQTMTAYIAQISQGDTPQGSVEFQSLFAVGLALFALTLGLNLIANAVIRRYKEAY
jgi:phosphate transport system permease protein